MKTLHLIACDWLYVYVVNTLYQMGRTAAAVLTRTQPPVHRSDQGLQQFLLLTTVLLHAPLAAIILLHARTGPS